MFINYKFYQPSAPWTYLKFLFQFYPKEFAVDKPQSSWYDARWNDLLEGTAVTKQDRDLSNLPSVTHQSHRSPDLEINLPRLLSPHLCGEKFKNIDLDLITQSDIIIASIESNDWWYKK